MMKNPVEVMVAIHDIGGHLKVVNGALHMVLPANAPATLKDEIRAVKAGLLDLFAHHFVIVRWDGPLLCLARDEAAKEALVLHGVDPGSIYLPHELQTLLDRSYTLHDLFAVCSTKAAFGGSIVNQ